MDLRKLIVAVSFFPLVLFVGHSTSTYAQNPEKTGPEFQVNTYTTNHQSGPSVATLSGGGFVVCWNSMGQDGDNQGVFGQRFDSAGSQAGAEFQVNTYTTSSQSTPSVAALSGGGFVVTWDSYQQDGDNHGIFGQRFDSGGSKAGTEFQVNTYTTHYQGAVFAAGLSDGGFVVTWHSYQQDGDSYGAYGQRYDSDGNTIGSEFPVNTYTTSDQTYPSVAAFSGGGFVVTWGSYTQDGSDDGIYGQMFDASGNKDGSEFPVNTYTTDNQSRPSVSTLSGGGFVVTWESDGQDGSDEGIYGRLYDSAGNTVGSEFQVNTYTTGYQGDQSAAPLSGGSFVVTWGSDGQDGSNFGIYGQLFRSASAMPWLPLLLLED